MPISSLLGATNQFTVDNSDPTNPIISISNSFAFPTGLNVVVPTQIQASRLRYTTFKNIWTTLGLPPSGETAFLYSDDVGDGNLSYVQYFPELGTPLLGFSWGVGHTPTLITKAYIDKVDNQISISLDLANNTAINHTNNSNTPAIALGCSCTNTTSQFITQPTDLTSISSQIIPSYLGNGQSLCIGQLPIAQVDPTATTLSANCLKYYLGNFYLYNNAGSAEFYFTLGSAFGAIAPTSNVFTSGNFYAFGYLGMTPYDNVDNINPNPTFNAVTYTYSLV